MAFDKENVLGRLEEKKHTTGKGVEYWKAREIQEILGYQRWDRFEDVVKRAMMACESSGIDPDHQFSKTGNMVGIGSGAQREVEDYFLTRYACYLIAMNGDTAKPEIGVAQTYFAVQTRLQEVQNQLTAQEKRLLLRQRVKNANKALNSAAKQSGVTHYPFFHDAGYKGLYGMGQGDVKRFKGIPEKESLLDCAGRAELAANEFRITQTEDKLRRDNVRGQAEAERTHRHVGTSVRETIQKLGGSMPEQLPAEPSIKRLAAKKPRKALPKGRSDGENYGWSGEQGGI